MYTHYTSHEALHDECAYDLYLTIFPFYPNTYSDKPGSFKKQ